MIGRADSRVQKKFRHLAAWPKASQMFSSLTKPILNFLYLNSHARKQLLGTNVFGGKRNFEPRRGIRTLPRKFFR
jgi:hypothetical protein